MVPNYHVYCSSNTVSSGELIKIIVFSSSKSSGLRFVLYFVKSISLSLISVGYVDI